MSSIFFAYCAIEHQAMCRIFLSPIFVVRLQRQNAVTQNEVRSISTLVGKALTVLAAIATVKSSAGNQVITRTV
jgi:hypothetical protein